MPGPLEGQVALVAGATRGASRAIAVELVRAGATVVATGRSSREHDPDVRGEMTITYRLEDAPGGGTLVTGLHQDLPPGVSASDNEVGWTMSLRKLAELVEDG